jgi:hypothetical protein
LLFPLDVLGMTSVAIHRALGFGGSAFAMAKALLINQKVLGHFLVNDNIRVTCGFLLDCRNTHSFIGVHSWLVQT